MTVSVRNQTECKQNCPNPAIRGPTQVMDWGLAVIIGTAAALALSSIAVVAWAVYLCAHKGGDGLDGNIDIDNDGGERYPDEQQHEHQETEDEEEERGGGGGGGGRGGIIGILKANGSNKRNCRSSSCCLVPRPIRKPTTYNSTHEPIRKPIHHSTHKLKRQSTQNNARTEETSGDAERMVIECLL